MRKNKLFRFIFIVPIFIYTVFLILLPLLYIFLISFYKSDSYGGMIREFNLDNYIDIFDGVYLSIFIKSFVIAIVTTVICILIAYPFVLALNHKSKRFQKIAMTLVMVPFLTNSLIRMTGIVILLRKNGFINSLFMDMGIISKPLNLMYNNLGIIIGMVYTLIPFMLLPLYSSVSSIDKKLIEASYDLGASKWKSFIKVILPSTFPALFNGALMVFTPALGCFFVIDILGGGKLMILGNFIKNQFLTSRNWPFGASVSIFLILITFILIRLYKRIGGKMDDLGGM